MYTHIHTYVLVATYKYNINLHMCVSGFSLCTMFLQTFDKWLKGIFSLEMQTKTLPLLLSIEMTNYSLSVVSDF